MNTPVDSLPFAIPEPIRWIAQDSDGEWWGYTAEPHRHDSGWYENEVGETLRLGKTAPVDWQHSLTRVNRVS
jgi:hypothetical protein